MKKAVFYILGLLKLYCLNHVPGLRDSPGLRSFSRLLRTVRGARCCRRGRTFLISSASKSEAAQRTSRGCGFTDRASGLRGRAFAHERDCRGPQTPAGRRENGTAGGGSESREEEPLLKPLPPSHSLISALSGEPLAQEPPGCRDRPD